MSSSLRPDTICWVRLYMYEDTMLDEVLITDMILYLGLGRSIRSSSLAVSAYVSLSTPRIPRQFSNVPSYIILPSNILDSLDPLALTRGCTSELDFLGEAAAATVLPPSSTDAPDTSDKPMLFDFV